MWDLGRAGWQPGEGLDDIDGRHSSIAAQLAGMGLVEKVDRIRPADAPVPPIEIHRWRITDRGAALVEGFC